MIRVVARMFRSDVHVLRGMYAFGYMYVVIGVLVNGRLGYALDQGICTHPQTAVSSDNTARHPQNQGIES